MYKLKKKLTFNYTKILLIFFILFLLLNFISKIFIQYDVNNEQKNHKNYDEFKMYVKYENILHHLKVNSYNKIPLIYEPIVIDQVIKNKTFLIQGDGWGEAFSVDLSKDKLKKFLINNNFSGYNAAMSSYSFSLFTVQLKILRNDFKIKPNIILTTIDYTDFVDEICKYNNKLIFKSNNLVSILPEDILSSDTPNQKLFLEKYKLFYSDTELSIMKVIKYYSLKIYRKLFKKQIKCNDSKLDEYLSKPLSNENKKILTEAYERYIYEVFNNNQVEKLILVSHPHEKHLKNNFINLWSEIINQTKFDKKIKEKILFIDFNNIVPEIYINNGINVDDIFIKDEKNSSHLTVESHLVFTIEILNKIKKYFN